MVGRPMFAMDRPLGHSYCGSEPEPPPHTDTGLGKFNREPRTGTEKFGSSFLGTEFTRLIQFSSRLIEGTKINRFPAIN